MKAVTPSKELKPKLLAPISTPQNPTSPARNLAPSPGLPSSKSPTMMSTGKRRLVGGGDDAFDQQVVRDLRKDIIDVQNFVDQQRGASTLNPVMRQLEADLLQAQRLPLADQLLFLLRTLQEKNKELANICGFSEGESGGIAGSLLTGCMQLVEMEEEIAAPSLLVAEPTADGPSMQFISTASAFLEEGSNVASPSPTAAFSPSSAMDGATSNNKRNSVGIVAAAASFARRASQRSTRRSSMRKSTSEAADETVSLSGVTPLTPNSVDMLRALGFPVAPGDELNANAIVAAVISVTTEVTAAKKDFDYRVNAAKEATKARENQHRLEVTALQHELLDAQTEAEMLRREIHGSRFGLNVVRSLTTVHDTPMSFEVEKKYQRDLYRSELRVQQLEAQYKKLFEDGDADRKKLKVLSGDVMRLNSEIANLNKQISKLREERAEHESLLSGVTNTRNEEARMCAAAVEQLESRISRLRADLAKEQRTVEVVVSNLKMLMTDWCIATKELEDLKKEHAVVKEEYAGYRGLYNKELAERLEAVSKLLLKVWEERDQEEAQRTVTKQLADDANNAYKALSDEFKMLSEKLRSSTEWKLLSIRAPEECKQLSVRLTVLHNEKEKREAASYAPLRERIELYKKRADEECGRRRAAHQEEVRLQKASSLDEELRQLMTRCKSKREQDKLASSAAFTSSPFAAGARKQPMELIDEYVAAARQNSLSFAAFYEQLYPSVDS